MYINFYSSTYSVDYDEVQEIVTFLQSKTSVKPEIGIICGSGLGGLADLIENSETIDYKDIPHFPVSTVAGHKGALVFGQLRNVPVVCMKVQLFLISFSSKTKLEPV